MPRTTKPLTVKEIKNARFNEKARKLFDGGGLFLLVTQAGRDWRFKYRFAGKERSPLALGVFPEVGLADAREERDRLRKLVAQGIDPRAHRQAEKAALMVAGANTFEAVAREWWDEVHRHNVVPEHSRWNLRRLETYVFPALGREPIENITPGRLLVVLRDVQKTGHIATAHRVRTVCGQVFRYAVQTSRVEHNVAADLGGAMKTPKVKHHPALTDNPADVGRLLRAIEEYGGEPTTIAALRLAPILFTRSGELLNARWEHFDLASSIWTFQPNKGGAPMLTPLPHQAVEILRELHMVTGPEGYVFPSSRRKDRPITGASLNKALRTMGFDVVMHGFRATAKTLLQERLNYPPEVIEMQLSHTVRDALGRAYNRTTYFEQRREMLQSWADYLCNLRDDVVDFKERATGTARV